MRSHVPCRGSRSSWALAFTSFGVLSVLAAAPGAARADALSCQRAVATASAQFAQAKMKALQKCEDGVVQHVSPGPCPDGTASAKIAQAHSKMRAAVSTGCGGADRSCGTGGDDTALNTVGWGGS